MPKYKVKSGSLNVTIEAQNHRMAAIKAIDENNHAKLGLLISILEDGKPLDKEIYMKAEFVLNCMGFVVQE